MDIIESGARTPARRRARTLTWAAGMGIVVAGLLAWKMAAGTGPTPATNGTDRAPAAAGTTAPALSPTEQPVSRSQPVPDHLRVAALAAVMADGRPGAAIDLAADDPGGTPSVQIIGEAVTDPGQYIVTMVCLGRGGVEVGAAGNADVGPHTDDVHVACLTAPDPETMGVTLGGTTLYLRVAADPGTVASFAYSVRPLD